MYGAPNVSQWAAAAGVLHVRYISLYKRLHSHQIYNRLTVIVVLLTKNEKHIDERERSEKSEYMSAGS